MKEKVTPDFTTMFEEAQKQLNRQFTSFSSLKKYAETIMGVSSVIVSFFATFKVFDSTMAKPSSFFVLFFFIVILYTILMVLAINLARPSSVESPIRADLENYNKAYADKNEKDIIMSQITIYVRAIQKNEESLKKQERLSKLMGYYLCTIVAFIFLATTTLLVH